jgi:hypothetical protein
MTVAHAAQLDSLRYLRKVNAHGYALGQTNPPEGVGPIFGSRSIPVQWAVQRCNEQWGRPLKGDPRATLQF